MFVHAVYFWLKDDIGPTETQQFLAGLDSLATIEGVHACHIGPPASTRREIIDSSYSCALIVTFANQADHDAYQTDPIHDRFRDTCAQLWKRVQIYDSITP